MTWRYVVSRDRIDDEDVYSMRELYTDDAGQLAWTELEVAPVGDDWADLAEALTMMSRALNDDMEILDLSLDPPRLVKRSELRTS